MMDEGIDTWLWYIQQHSLEHKVLRTCKVGHLVHDHALEDQWRRGRPHAPQYPREVLRVPAASNQARQQSALRSWSFFT